MKVLFITDPGIVGGATRSLVELSTKLKSKNVQCIVCTSDESSLNRELEHLGIQTTACHHMAAMEIQSPTPWKRPIKGVLRKVQRIINLPRAVNIVRSEVDLSQIDLIHTNSARNDLGCILSRRYNIPHIMHIREFGQEDFGCRTYRHNYTSYLNDGVDRFIAISDAVANSWISKGIDPEKVVRIYNGVFCEDIESADLKTLKSKTLHMVIAGGICEPKGQITAVEAINLLPQEILHNIHLDIIGWSDPIYEKMLREKVSAYGLYSNISFVGAKKNIHPILKNYQIALMCSKAEGFGRVTAEYMHARLGVIATDTGANPEIIQDEENGLLYRYNEPQSLAEKIIRFYYHRELLISCAKKARDDARQKYTIECNATSIKKLYEQMVRR